MPAPVFVSPLQVKWFVFPPFHMVDCWLEDRKESARQWGHDIYLVRHNLSYTPGAMIEGFGSGFGCGSSIAVRGEQDAGALILCAVGMRELYPVSWSKKSLSRLVVC